MSVQLQKITADKKYYIHHLKLIRLSLEKQDSESMISQLRDLQDDLSENKASKQIISEIICALMNGVSITSKSVYQELDALYWGEQAWFKLLARQSVGTVFGVVSTTLQHVMTRDIATVYDTNTAFISQKVKRMIDDHFPKAWSTSELAQAVHLSPNYLSRIFKRETGETLTDYITRLRIDRAKQMLREEWHLKTYEIGELVGYPDPVYFTKLFKKTVGMTPKVYRLAKL